MMTTVVDTVSLTPAAEAFIDEANELLDASTTNYLELGRRILKAKIDLRERGVFGKALKSRRFKYGDRQARVLMRIVRNPVFADRHSDSVFPRELVLLKVLASIPADELRSLIERGVVYPAMQLADLQGIGLMRPEKVAEGFELLVLYCERPETTRDNLIEDFAEHLAWSPDEIDAKMRALAALFR